MEEKGVAGLIGRKCLNGEYPKALPKKEFIPLVSLFISILWRIIDTVDFKNDNKFSIVFVKNTETR
jgi:hypothetical protein